MIYIFLATPYVLEIELPWIPFMLVFLPFAVATTLLAIWKYSKRTVI